MTPPNAAAIANGRIAPITSPIAVPIAASSITSIEIDREHAAPVAPSDLSVAITSRRWSR